jgi:hypothetical protein
MRDALMRVGALPPILLVVGCQSGQPATTRGIDAPYAYCAATHDPTSEGFADCWRRQLSRGNDACKALLDSAGAPGVTQQDRATIYLKMRDLQC